MNPERLERLADFTRRHRPDTTAALGAYREEILHLHFRGYSLALIFKFVKEQGVMCSRSAFYRWVQAHIDFEAEAGARGANTARGALSAADQGEGQARTGPVVQKPLLHGDAPTVSLAGVP